MKTKHFSLLALPIVSLVLELLPFGAVLNFANPEGDAFRETYSYFDLLPVGYANVGPFLTAITTCLLIVLTIIYLFTKNDFLSRILKTIPLFGLFFSLCPLFYGTRYYSLIGGVISVLFFLQFFLSRYILKKR